MVLTLRVLLHLPDSTHRTSARAHCLSRPVFGLCTARGGTSITRVAVAKAAPHACAIGGFGHVPGDAVPVWSPLAWAGARLPLTMRWTDRHGRIA